MRELTAKNNAVLMNFNTRDVRDINIINHINHKAKKIHRKREEQFEPLEQLTPAKPFSSLYASPTEAPMAQLNRFYIPERIRATPTDGVDVGSQIQEMTRSYQQVPETKQTVVPPAKGEEFGVQPEVPEGFATITEPQQKERKSRLRRQEDLQTDEIVEIQKVMLNVPEGEKGRFRQALAKSFNVSVQTIKAFEAQRSFGMGPLPPIISESQEPEPTRMSSQPRIQRTQQGNTDIRSFFPTRQQPELQTPVEPEPRPQPQPQPPAIVEGSIEEIEVPKPKSKKPRKKIE